MKIKLFLFAGVTLLLCQLFISTANAQTQLMNPALDETFTFRLGPFWANLDTTVKAEGYDLKVDEGLDAGNVNFSANGLWRITKRLRLEVAYSGFDKEKSLTLGSDINIDSITIPSGSTIYANVETEVLRLALGFAVFRGDSYEAGIDLGVNYTTLQESFGASVSGIGSREIEAFDVSAPLPTIGLFFNYAFTDKWYLTSRAGVFSFVEVGDYDGTVWDVFGSIEYRPWQHFGLGLAYTYTSADLTVTDNNRKFDIEYDYSGPLLYFVVGF
jgi:hypothetical protein